MQNLNQLLKSEKNIISIIINSTDLTKAQLNDLWGQSIDVELGAGFDLAGFTFVEGFAGFNTFQFKV